MAKKDRTGERFTNREDLGGYEFVIVEYNNANDLWVEFQDEYKARIHTQYNVCELGNVKNPYHPNTYGGYIGQGKYKSKIDGKQTKEYKEWESMLQRCYDEKYQNKYPTYKGVVIDEYFYNFQNYGLWREDNYYEIEGERMELDKDILYKGNKIYAPDKCIFVPQRINKLFIKSDASRGKYPIGVCYHKANGKYQANCNTLNGHKYLGCYNTSEEAFLAYKEFKEVYIKQVADEYKERIPDRLYEAMYVWEIEEDD